MTAETSPERSLQRWTAAAEYPDMWVDPADDPREKVDEGVGEKALLSAYLGRYRMTFEMKCEGLDAGQLAQRSVPPSNMSLLGLLRHLADVEHSWCRRFIEGQPDLPRLFRSPADRDLDFNGAVADDAVAAEAWAAWRAEVAHARDVYAGVEDLGALVGPEGHQAEVRDVVVHLIEEYARHCGHADLLRERIDGRVGQ
ncbi:MAG TPA: DinB family protein [Nocardioidaceae bacterium]|nr:DinB family protein [Nocardioidaceae bacterium]